MIYSLIITQYIMDVKEFLDAKTNIDYNYNVIYYIISMNKKVENGYM